MTPLWGCACAALGAGVLVAHHLLWRRHTSLAVVQAREAVLRQLSHDIRSPLAALETVLDKVEGLAEQDRALIGAAATRLRDIANTLAPNIGSSKTVATAEPLLLEMEYAVSQLRHDLRSRSGAGIDLRLDKSSFSTAFTSASRAQLREALNSHVNDSVGDSHVAQQVTVRCEGEQVQVRNLTTDVTRSFTPSTSPAAPWFVNTMSWPAGGTVVITDDDEAVHTAWHTRLNALPAGDKPRLLHLKTLADLKTHVASLSAAALAERVFWVDCEFTDSRQTGLDAIGALGIGKQSALVTSHYDDGALRERCVALGTKLLPKTLLHSVPLRPRTGHTVVLIDDDTLVHHMWRMAARGGKQGLQTFAHPDEFLRDMDTYARTTPVYIDSQLGEGLRGEDVAKTVHARGFAQVYLTTGRDPATFPAMPWVTAVLGKEPPF